MNKPYRTTALLFTLLAHSLSTQAACPASITGNYIGYQTDSELNSTTHQITNIANSVFLVNFDKNNTVKVTQSTHVSADNPVGLQQNTPEEIISYRYDKTTCSVRVWESAAGSSKSDAFFVVGNSGAVLNGVQQDVGDNQSKLFVLTKQ